MKKHLYNILTAMLYVMARSVLWRHKPLVIGVTGSVGKTSTRTAVAHVVRRSYRVREPEKNYNNELGLPLTVIGAHAAGRSPLGWALVGWKWLIAMITLSRYYPEVLILEYGIDQPGDMAHLTKIVPPHIAVATNVSGVHKEYFGTVSAIAKEKEALVRAIVPHTKNAAILNVDNSYTKKMKPPKGTRIITTAVTSAEATLRAQDISSQFAEGVFQGIIFKLHYDGASIPVRLPHIIAEHHAYTALSALAVAVAMDMNIVEAARSLEKFLLPAGRMNLLQGKKDAMVIDDTYNASPHSVEAAIATLGQLPSTRRVAVLGDMLELGDACQSAHEEVGRLLVRKGIDQAILVGRHVAYTAEVLQKEGWGNDRLQIFLSPLDAAPVVEMLLARGTAVLVKGSQGMRMEKIVERIMADHGDVERLLTRQDRSWRAKKFVLHSEGV